jgi:hypothetical protein
MKINIEQSAGIERETRKTKEMCVCLLGAMHSREKKKKRKKNPKHQSFAHRIELHER